MEDDDGKIVPVELITALLVWKCPSCAFENEKMLKRSAHAVSVLSCEKCGIEIEKKGRIYWTVK